MLSLDPKDVMNEIYVCVGTGSCQCIKFSPNEIHKNEYGNSDEFKTLCYALRGPWYRTVRAENPGREVQNPHRAVQEHLKKGWRRKNYSKENRISSSRKTGNLRLRDLKKKLTTLILISTRL